MRESQSSRTRTLLRLAIISTTRFDDTLQWQIFSPFFLQINTSFERLYIFSAVCLQLIHKTPLLI